MFAYFITNPILPLHIQNKNSLSAKLEENAKTARFNGNERKVNLGAA
jgi:hypothetical protein